MDYTSFINSLPSKKEFEKEYLVSFKRTTNRTAIWYENLIEQIKSKLEFSVFASNNRNAKEIIETLKYNYQIEPRYFIKDDLIIFNKA